MPGLYLKCPKCGSVHIKLDKQGYNYWIPIACFLILIANLVCNNYTWISMFILFPLSILGGFIYSNAPVITCQECGFSKSKSLFLDYKGNEYGKNPIEKF